MSKPIANISKGKPIALMVFLENVGHIHGLPLPQWAMDVVDYVTEEYAKVLLRIYGAYRHYTKVIILEDEQANSMLTRQYRYPFVVPAAGQV